MEQEKVIQIRDLKVYYKQHRKNIFSKKRRLQVLKGVSIDVFEGEILGLAGESGCGKSTLAKAIVGMNKDIEGVINLKYSDTQMVFQDPYSSLNPSKKIGWLLEERSVCADETGARCARRNCWIHTVSTRLLTLQHASRKRGVEGMKEMDFQAKYTGDYDNEIGILGRNINFWNNYIFYHLAKSRTHISR